nr:hypothetical protein [Tanacetum cinerariifolium]
FVNHQPREIPEVIPFIESKEWIETKNEFYKMMEAYTKRMNQQREQEALLAAQREKELREQEQAAQREQELLAQKQAAQEKEEPPQNSDFCQLIEEIESEVTSDNESECGMPVNDESSLIFTPFSNPLFDCNDDFTSSADKSLSNEDVPMENFKIYSNPLFIDEEIIFTKIDPHYFNAESNLLESLLNRDTLIDSFPKFDYLLEEFSDELTHIDPIPSGIGEATLI